MKTITALCAAILLFSMYPPKKMQAENTKVQYLKDSIFKLENAANNNLLRNYDQRAKLDALTTELISLKEHLK